MSAARRDDARADPARPRADPAGSPASVRARDADADAARVVLVTAPDVDGARASARELVGRRIAACASLVPGIESVYRWRGAIEEAREVLIVVKTTAGRIDALERALAELHPYEVPECVALAPSSVAARYAAWLSEETAPADGRG